MVDDFVLVRTSNYELDVAPGPSWEPDTINYLGRLRDRKVENLNPLDDHHRSRLVMRNGLEDGRLIRHNGRLLGLFSALFQTSGPGVVTKNTMTLVDLETFDYKCFPTGQREKNWMPFIHNGDLYAIRSTSPLEIVNLIGVNVLEGRGLGSFWSGSSQLIPYGTGYLGVVHRHESTDPRWGCRDYVHAFVYMDENFNLDLSPPFRFFGKGVEFCAGLEFHGNELCISFGVHDNESYLLWLPIKER